MRRWADRLDRARAPKAIGWSFTFERGRGVVFREAPAPGCPIWYVGDDQYHRAHTEAVSESEPAWERGL